ncbi:TPA: LysR family transcriptional regulator [Raoultella planticola]
MSKNRPESYWTHLHWLTVLEEQKSYTRAAEKLAVSKSAVSQKISELEAIGRGLVQELLPGWRPVDVFAPQRYVIRPFTPRVPRAVETFSRYLKSTFN